MLRGRRPPVPERDDSPSAAPADLSSNSRDSGLNQDPPAYAQQPGTSQTANMNFSNGPQSAPPAPASTSGFAEDLRKTRKGLVAGSRAEHSKAQSDKDRQERAQDVQDKLQDLNNRLDRGHDTSSFAALLAELMRNWADIGQAFQNKIYTEKLGMDPINPLGLPGYLKDKWDNRKSLHQPEAADIAKMAHVDDDGKIVMEDTIRVRMGEGNDSTHRDVPTPDSAKDLLKAHFKEKGCDLEEGQDGRFTAKYSTSKFEVPAEDVKVYMADFEKRVQTEFDNSQNQNTSSPAPGR